LLIVILIILHNRLFLNQTMRRQRFLNLPCALNLIYQLIISAIFRQPWTSDQLSGVKYSKNGLELWNLMGAYLAQKPKKQRKHAYVNPLSGNKKLKRDRQKPMVPQYLNVKLDNLQI